MSAQTLRFDMAKAMHLVHPAACRWASREMQEILLRGNPLPPELLTVARLVKVANAESIRLEFAPIIPIPEEPILQAAFISEGMFNPKARGITFFYGVLIRDEYHNDLEVIAHEFSHVAQYETAGSISQFLKDYRLQIASVGYHDARLEREARETAALVKQRICAAP
jgi:hypothetical protein